MQNIFSMENLERWPQLEEYLNGLILWETLLRFDQVSQSATIAVLVDQVVVIGSPQHFNELDDVGVVYFGENVDLIVGEVTKFGSMLKFFCAHDFHCE